MTNSDSLCVILFPFLLASVSVAVDCPYYLRTREAFLSSKSHPIDPTEWYSAVNVTLRTNETTVERLFRFFPAATWRNLSCEGNTSAETLVSRISSSGTKSTEEVLTTLREYMPKLPAWSLWADRSVLVMNIHKMKLPISDQYCSQLSICPIFGLPSDELLNISNEALSLCEPELSEFSGDCHDAVHSGSIYSVLFPVSSALAVRLSQLDHALHSTQPDLNFVVSAGYRLPPGVFHCPVGLFACPLPATSGSIQEFPKSSIQWDQRICLPLALRCDGVPNCPISAFDELDCSDAHNMSTASGQFPEIPDELDQLVQTHLRFQDQNVLRTVGHSQVSLAMAGASKSLVLYSVLFGLPLVGALLIVSGWLFYKRSCRKPITSIIESNGHARSSKDEIHSELLEEAVRLQNGNGAMHDKSFDNGHGNLTAVVVGLNAADSDTSPLRPMANRIHVERV